MYSAPMTRRSRDISARTVTTSRSLSSSSIARWSALQALRVPAEQDEDVGVPAGQRALPAGARNRRWSPSAAVGAEHRQSAALRRGSAPRPVSRSSARWFSTATRGRADQRQRLRRGHLGAAGEVDGAEQRPGGRGRARVPRCNSTAARSGRSARTRGSAARGPGPAPCPARWCRRCARSSRRRARSSSPRPCGTRSDRPRPTAGCEQTDPIGSGVVHRRQPKPSTTLTNRSDSTPITRNEVCIKPGMLQPWRRCISMSGMSRTSGRGPVSGSGW